jgi:hypothetical protein
MKPLTLCSLLLLAFVSMAQARQKTTSTQVDNISGMYTFLQEGEFVQIDMEEGNRVTGFVSRLGNTDSDKGAVLDHLIKEGELKGNQIHFKTRALHGIWYEFFGTVQQDNSKAPGQEGFHIMKGKLFQYVDNGLEKPNGKSREITMKSFPMDDIVKK